jgi:hypothetical protein
MSVACRNCGEVHGGRSECLVAVLADLVKDRTGEPVSPGRLALVDVDELWEAVGGPAIDWLEEALAEHEHTPRKGSRNRLTADTVEYQCIECGEFYGVAE